MDSNYDLGTDDIRAIVYVRPVRVDDLPAELRGHVGDLTTVYAVHSAQGARLALVGNRELAFALARQNNLDPVTVH